MKAILELLKPFLMYGAVIIVAGILYLGYAICDEAGLAVHHATIEMSIAAPDWLSGESRNCEAAMTQVGRTSEYRVKSMICPAGKLGDSHTLKVTFWGRIQRQNVHPIPYDTDVTMAFTDWRCSRGWDGFTCYAVN